VVASERTILAIDIGTMSVRAAAYDLQGRRRAYAAKPIGLNRLDDTRVEQDPDELWQGVQNVVQQVLRDPAVGEVVAAGLASQRSSVVAWDRLSGAALSPVLSWQDRRAADYLTPLAGKQAAVKKQSGLFLSAHYGAGKMRWLLEHCAALSPARESGTLVLGPLAAYLLFKLLADHPVLVDHVNASRTQLFDLERRAWSPALLADFGLAADLLPRLRPTQSQYGKIAGTEIPVTAVNGDQNASIYGAGALDDGTLIVNIGTGAFILLPTGGQPIHHPSLLTSLANSSSENGTYLLEGTVNGAGAALQWAAEQWGEPALTEKLPHWLADVSDPPVFLNSIGGLGSPLWQADVSPRFLSAGSIAEKAVGIVESIIFLININLEVMASTGVNVKRISISGGLAGLDPLCQRLADLSQRVVVRSHIRQATARGIAWLASGSREGWADGNGDGRGDYFMPRLNRGLQGRYRRFCTAVGWL
jgi:glycerol kinase